MHRLRKLITVWIAMGIAKLLSKILDWGERRNANELAEWEATLHPTGMRGPDTERY